MDRVIELSHLRDRVWAYRKPIAILVFTVTLLTGVVAFLLPPWYRATASLLPPAEEETGFGLARLLRGGSVPGLRIPTQSTPADVFIAILESRRINEEIVKRFDLKNRYKSKMTEDAVRELRDHVKFQLTDAGTIDLAVEDRDPKLAAEMARTYIELLDQFNREVRMTKGRRTRLFVEERLDENKQQLAAAERRLADYQTENKAAVLSPEVSTAVETAARLYGQRAALQVRLGVVRSYSSGTDEEQQIVQQLAELDRQLKALPETGLDLARLLREVKTHEQVYVLLTAQYEEARIDEARDVVTVEVLDEPQPPQRKVRPRRGIMIIAAFFASLAVGVAYALLREEQRPRRMMTSAASG